MNAFKSDLNVIERNGRYWELGEDLTFQGREREFTVKKGYVTDLASVPRIFWPLLPSKGTYSKAAVLHDLLWQLSKKYYKKPIPKYGGLRVGGKAYPYNYLIDPVDVDGMFRRAMRILGTNFLVRWPMWWAVRTAAMVTGRVGAMRLKEWLQWLGVLVGLLVPLVGLVAGLAFLL